MEAERHEVQEVPRKNLERHPVRWRKRDFDQSQSDYGLTAHLHERHREKRFDHQRVDEI